MPVMKYSALDTGGTYRPDAMDQVEQWNANRGDQWSRYALDMMQKRQDDQRQSAADDWRKEVALKQLGLQENMWKGGREDSAAERAANADWRSKELEYRGQESAAERAFRERGLQMGERQFNFQMTQAEKAALEKENAAAERKAKADAYKRLAGDPNAFSDPRTLASRIGEIDPEAGMPMLVEKMLAEERRKEAERGLAAGQVPALLQSTDPAERKRGMALAGKANMDPSLFTPARIGQTNPDTVLQQDPELMNKIEEIAGQVSRLSIYGGGSQEQAAAGQMARDQLWNLAQQKAQEYGADPTRLFRAMEQQLSAKMPRTTSMQDIGRSISTLGGILDDPRAKYANQLLGQ
jgi:hypothetical protein